MADARIEQFNAEVDKIVDYLHSEFAKLQTGRASATLVEHVHVEAYGTKQPLKAVAGITVEDARSIVIQPWDKAVLGAIDTALQKADLGCSPQNDGNIIRLNLPPMTEERRRDLVKIVHQFAEEARISLRQQRGKVNDDIKSNESDEDVKFTLLEQLEDAVKAGNERIEVTKKKKEEEIMTV